jgi:CheY-like chemotaxis protein
MRRSGFSHPHHRHLVAGVDGIELMTRLRHDDRTKSTPIVVLTACAFRADAP